MPLLLHMSSWHGAQLSKRDIFMAWYLIMHRDNFIFTFTLSLSDCTS